MSQPTVQRWVISNCSRPQCHSLRERAYKNILSSSSTHPNRLHFGGTSQVTIALLLNTLRAIVTYPGKQSVRVCACNCSIIHLEEQTPLHRPRCASVTRTLLCFLDDCKAKVETRGREARHVNREKPKFNSTIDTRTSIYSRGSAKSTRVHAVLIVLALSACTEHKHTLTYSSS